MKKLIPPLFALLFFTLDLFLGSGDLPAQTYSWAMTDNTYEKSNGVALTQDANGNLFVAETYSNTGLKSGVNIIKYDASHNLVWKQKIEGKYFAYYALASDKDGSICFTSSFGDSLFINGAYSAFSNEQNLLLVKFNAQGVVQFVKQSTGGQVWGRKVTTDSESNIYVGGMLNGSPNFDGTTITSPSVVYNFIAKYNTAGVLLWIRNGSNNSFSGWGIGMATDSSNNTYLAGTFKGTVYFGSLSLTSYGSTGSEDIYLAKIDASGNWLWAKHAGGYSQDGLFALALDVSQNPYISGFIGSTTAFFGNISLTNTGHDDYFAAKYDPSGNSIWAINGGGPGSQFGIGIAIDASGTVYLARNSIYYCKFDNNGTYLGSDTKNAGNLFMIRSNDGCIYITGDINTSISFGSYNLSPTQPQQMYIAKLCNTTSLDVPESEEKILFEVYPNPTPGIINLKISSPIENAYLSIKNILGQIIYTEFLTINEASFIKQINLSGLPKGIYFVELKGNHMAYRPYGTAKKVIIR